MSILVVDDATVMRIVLKDMLSRHCGYEPEEIIEAKNGDQAILFYKKHHPEIVLLDIGMPGKNGLEVVKAILEDDPDANIVMCTSSKEKENVIDCIIAGAKDYIVKPPQLERVRNAITKITGRVFETDEEETGEAEG